MVEKLPFDSRLPEQFLVMKRHSRTSGTSVTQGRYRTFDDALSQISEEDKTTGLFWIRKLVDAEIWDSQ